MIDESLTQKVIDYLNELLEIDPAAIEDLVKTRVPCSNALSWHPTVQVVGGGECPAMVGLLGIINGLCGVDADGWGPVAARYDEAGNLFEFSRMREEWKGNVDADSEPTRD